MESPGNIEELLKSLLVLSRTVDQVLETRAVATASRQALPLTKVRVLRLLGHRGGQSASRVANFLGVSKPAVTQIIDSLIRANLVVRRPTEHDRRAVVIELTPLGRATFRAVSREQRHLVRTALKVAKTRDARSWVAALRDISRALAKAEGVFEHFCLQCGAHADGTCVLEGGDAECRYLQQGHTRAR